MAVKTAGPRAPKRADTKTGRTIRFPPDMLDYLQREASAYETDLAEIVRQHIRRTRKLVESGEPLFEKER